MSRSLRKLYTRYGDVKTTGILGGVRLSKHSSRIEAIGSLDELNSFLGFLLALSENVLRSGKERKIQAVFARIVERIQEDLFIVGADLSQPLIQLNTIPHPLHHHYDNSSVPAADKLPQLSQSHIHFLEQTIDHFQSQLPPIRNFILPRGNPIGAFLQVVRAICRRSERRVVQLAANEEIDPLILAYLNRLSDLLFVLARAINFKGRRREILWKHD